VIVVEAHNGVQCAILNLQGRTYMPQTDCPFREGRRVACRACRLGSMYGSSISTRELTSEKMAMGWYLDGRVSAVIGTHTHIPTADTRVLPNGTAYQTDVGMTGPYHSVIGVDKDIILQRFLTQLPVRMEAARHGAELHAGDRQVDEATGRAVGIAGHGAVAKSNVAAELDQLAFQLTKRRHRAHQLAEAKFKSDAIVRFSA